MSEDQIEIGRILRANTTGFAVGSRVNQLSTHGFGSLVKAQPVGEQEAVYGLIYNIHIDDDQLIRRLVMIEDPRPEVIEDQRRNRILPIEMSVLAVGYRSKDQLQYSLPPRPPLNLDPVMLVENGRELWQFTDDPGYLRLILRADSNRVPVDQLLVAHMYDTYLRRGEDAGWVVSVVRELIELLRSNYEVLIPTLEALSSVLPGLNLETTR